MKDSIHNKYSARRIPAFITTLTLAAGLAILTGCNTTDTTGTPLTSSASQAVSASSSASQTELATTISATTSVETEASSATATTDKPTETSAPTTVSTAPPMHSVDPDPNPLDADDMVLSPEGYGAIGALADENLTIYDMLTYAVEDEYLAHGEYVAIMEKFGTQRPYENIARSEESHLSFLKDVYDSYGLPFPCDRSADHLVIPENLLEAAKTGVQAEVDNIAMYDRFLEYDLPDNIQSVFEALLRGSENHLRAFQQQVSRLS